MRILDRLLHLRRGVARGGKWYNHKPLLLLALIDRMEEAPFRENQFPVDDRLKELFRQRWVWLEPGTNVGKISRPLHHLAQERIWFMVDRDGKVIGDYIESFNTLQNRVAFGKFDTELFSFLRDANHRELTRMVILDAYFPKTKINYRGPEMDNPLISEIEAEILKEPRAAYRRVEKEWEGYVRIWKFRYHINRIYDQTCAISGWRVTAPYTLIEACHIRPFAKYGINHLSNGIALSPNFHRAFDLGLIAIDPGYRVLVSKALYEEASAFSIRQFEGQKIRLPENADFRPALEHLAWHLKEVFME